MDQGPRVQRGVAEEDLEGVDAREELEQASADIRGGVSDFFGQDIALLGGESLTEAEGVTGSLVRGAEGAVAGIADVPGTALGLAEAGQFAGERGAEVVGGDIDEAVDTTVSAGEEVLSDLERSFEEDPVQFTTTLGVSLGATAAGFGAASAIGPRAGLGTRLAVQPGEELVGQIGGRTTRALAGERVADRLFPNNEPFLLSEEAALRGVNRGLEGARDRFDAIENIDVGIAGPGAGFPALEVEIETEQEEGQPEIRREDIETPTLLVESQRLQTEIEQELLFESELETETESELEAELERVNTRLEGIFGGGDQEIGLDQQLDPELSIDQRFEQLQEPIDRLDQVTDLEQRLAQETEQRQRFESETETEQEQRFELQPPREIEVEPRLFEPQLPDPDEVIPTEALAGVRSVEAFVDPSELEVD
jgi:hypothetical protein